MLKCDLCNEQSTGATGEQVRGSSIIVYAADKNWKHRFGNEDLHHICNLCKADFTNALEAERGRVMGAVEVQAKAQALKDITRRRK